MLDGIQIYWVIGEKKTIRSSVFKGLETYFNMNITKISLDELLTIKSKKIHIMIFDNISIKDIDYSSIAELKENNKSMHTIFVAKELNEKESIKIYNKHFDYILLSSFGSAHARAKLRNVLNRKSSKYIQDDIVFDFGKLEVNRAEREIKANGIIINFTETEYKIVSKLARSRDFITKKDLFKFIWGYEEDSSRLLDQYIHRVKKKLGDNASFIIDREKGIKLIKE